MSERNSKIKVEKALQEALERSSGLNSLNDNIFKRDQKWPLVTFTNGMEILCAPVNFTAEGLRGNTEALRMQVPLILAWALSVHKSQGQTLSRVKVDLGETFEKGQGNKSFNGFKKCH